MSSVRKSDEKKRKEEEEEEDQDFHKSTPRVENLLVVERVNLQHKLRRGKR